MAHLFSRSKSRYLCLIFFLKYPLWLPYIIAFKIQVNFYGQNTCILCIKIYGWYLQMYTIFLDSSKLIVPQTLGKSITSTPTSSCTPNIFPWRPIWTCRRCNGRLYLEPSQAFFHQSIRKNYENSRYKFWKWFWWSSNAQAGD